MAAKCQFCSTGWIGGGNRCAICGRRAKASNVDVDIKVNLPDGFDGDGFTKAVEKAAEAHEAQRAAGPCDYVGPPRPVPTPEEEEAPKATLPDGRLLGTGNKVDNRNVIKRIRGGAAGAGLALEDLVVAYCSACRQIQTANGAFKFCEYCQATAPAWQMPFLDFEARYGAPQEIAAMRGRIAGALRYFVPLLARALMDDGDLAGAGEVLSATAAMGKALGQ